MEAGGAGDGILSSLSTLSSAVVGACTIFFKLAFVAFAVYSAARFAASSSVVAVAAAAPRVHRGGVTSRVQYRYGYALWVLGVLGPAGAEVF